MINRFEHLFSKKVLLIFFSVLLFSAFILRIYNLTNVSMYGDELTIVYDTYSILKTGHDQLGNFLPITFPMGAGRPGGYIYGSLPFVGLFGPTVFGVRGLSIVSGLGIIIVSYFLIKGLSFSKGVGVIAGILLAVTPWAVNLSRGGFESHFGLFLSLNGLASLLYVERKPWLLFVSAVTIGLAIHTYPTFKLTLPLMLLLFGWYVGGFKWFKDKRIQKYLFSAIAVLSVFAVLSLVQTFSGGSEARFLSINIFSDETLTRSITENVVIERNLSELSGSADQLFHNRYLEYPVILLKNYFDSLSVRYLFLEGDYNPRHNMTQSGAFYVVELLTVLIGTVTLLFKQRKVFYLLLGWILIAPLSTALLTEVHTLRNSLLFVPLSVLSAIGFYTLFTLREKKFRYFSAVLVIFFIVQLSFVFEKLYFVSPNLFSRHWAYPAMQLSEHIEREKHNYDYVIVRDNIDNVEYAYPTYALINPSDVVKAGKQRVDLNNKQFKQFGNVYIGGFMDSEAEQFLTTLHGRVLYFANTEQMKSLTNYQIVTGKDNLPSFIVKEVQQ